MASMFFEFDHDEIHDTIPYAFISETRYGSAWNTMRRRRLWNATFTEEERKLANKLCAQAHDWHVGRGVPDTVKMKSTTYDMWRRLAAFCASL